MCKNILLIGGTGTLSTAVMKRTVMCGYNVYVLNRGNRNEMLLPSVIPLIADFYDAGSIRKAIEGLSFAVVVDFLSRKSQDVERTFPLFLNVKQYILISSACVYRRFPEDGVLTENAPKPNNNWSYSIEKLQCEEVLMKLSKNYGINYTIVRPYITYDNRRIPFGLAPTYYTTHWTIAARILSGKPLFLWDDGMTRCTLTHVDDFAIGLVGLFENSQAYNEDFHIVSDKSQSWLDMLLLLYKTLDVKPNIIFIPTDYICRCLPEYRGMLLGDRSLNAEFDISKLKSAVPYFEPSVSLEDGLAEVIAYYRAHNFLDGIDYAWDGKIDRLISSYGKSCNLHYRDYLGEKRISNYWKYLIGRHVLFLYLIRVYVFLRKRLWRK